MACMIITFRSLPSMQILHAKNVMSNKGNTNSQIMESSSLSLIDSVAIHNMGDSISSIVFDADSIVVEVVVEDSSEDDKCKLTGWKSQLLKYMLCQKSMYVSNKPVFGIFSPFVIVSFHKDSNYVIAEFDYGINKWRLMDKGTSVIIEKDLLDCMLLPLFYSLFPTNELISMTYLDYIKK